MEEGNIKALTSEKFNISEPHEENESGGWMGSQRHRSVKPWDSTHSVGGAAVLFLSDCGGTHVFPYLLWFVMLWRTDST